MGGAAQATTLLEADVKGGEYSADFRAPTVIEAGIVALEGTGGAKSDDYFVFTGLPSGAQDITLSFFAPEKYGYSYSAGGTVLFDNAPFDHEWDGKKLNKKVQIDYRSPRQTLTLSLNERFTGSLYLALNFTHGADLRYAVFTPSNGFDGRDIPNAAEGAFQAPSQVPLPPALLLLGTGVLGFVYLGRVRKA